MSKSRHPISGKRYALSRTRVASHDDLQPRVPTIAEHYSNGILLVITPAPGPTWASCAHITPLSDEATKTEYLFGPGSTFLCGPSSQQIIDGRPTTVIELSEVANLGG